MAVPARLARPLEATAALRQARVMADRALVEHDGWCVVCRGAHGHLPGRCAAGRELAARLASAAVAWLARDTTAATRTQRGGR